jgi:hypothetical protein
MLHHGRYQLPLYRANLIIALYHVYTVLVSRRCRWIKLAQPELRVHRGGIQGLEAGMDALLVLADAHGVDSPGTQLCLVGPVVTKTRHNRLSDAHRYNLECNIVIHLQYLVSLSNIGNTKSESWPSILDESGESRHLHCGRSYWDI